MLQRQIPSVKMRCKTRDLSGSFRRFVVPVPMICDPRLPAVRALNCQFVLGVQLGKFCLEERLHDGLN